MAHPERVPLRPRVVAGPIWRRHRHFLVPDRPIARPGSYVVVDATTGRRYAWDIWPPGSTTIGVPTTWAYTHHAWMSRAFYLVPATEGECHPDGGKAPGPRGTLGRVLAWLRDRLI